MTASANNDFYEQPPNEVAPLQLVGPNFWSAAAGLDAINRETYWFGGKAESAAWVHQNPSYPHLMITERTNVQSHAYDSWAQYASSKGGGAMALHDISFECEEYSYVQFSKNYYGYLDVLGVGTNGLGGAWTRQVDHGTTPNGFMNVLFRTHGDDWGAGFTHQGRTDLYLLNPGYHAFELSQEIHSNSFWVPWVISPGRTWHSHESHQNVGDFPLPSSAWWVYPAPQETSSPNSIQVIQGFPASGNLSSVVSSNDNRLSLNCDERKQAATLQFQAQFTAARPDLALRVYVEANISRPGMIQTLSLLNLQTGLYDVVDTRDATLADAHALARTEQLSKYIQSGSNGVTGRITWTPNPKRRIAGSWTAAIDEIRLIGFRR